MFACLLTFVRKERADNKRVTGFSGYEEELPAPLSKPPALRTQPRHPCGLSGREGEPDMAADYGGAQEIELGRIRGRDLLEVIGKRGNGGGGRRDVAGREGAVFHLSTCRVNCCRKCI